MRTLHLMTAAAALALSAPAFAQDNSFTYVTDWVAQAEHGGMYQAIATGLYEKYGVEISIRAGGPQIDNQQLLAAGAAEFGTGSNSFFPVNMVNAGAPVSAVMAMFQKDPQVLMMHPRDDINSFEDMVGNPILISSGSVNTFWVWLEAQYGFTEDMIRPYTFNMAPWLVDETAIQQGYLSSEPFLAISEGIEPEVYLIADTGYPSYSSLALVQNSLIEENPEAVQGFVTATIEGWYSYLYGDSAPGNELIMADNPEMSQEKIDYGIAKMREFGILTSGDAVEGGIGVMTDERWGAFFDVMVEAGIYEADLDITEAYTLEFLN